MTGQTCSNTPTYTYTLTAVNVVTKLVIERKLIHISGIKPTRNFGLTFVIDAEGEKVQITGARRSGMVPDYVACSFVFLGSIIII
jgi:hypothetical protein